MTDLEAVGRAAQRLRRARHAVALTGAGISVASGIPDFRSRAGLWSIFDPAEYATLACFLHDPDKAWRMYRALGASLMGRAPNAGHVALAALERAGLLAGVITQNVDGLHQQAGSERVIEMHGDARSLQCPGCGRSEPMRVAHLEPGPAPRCPECGGALKPNVVLFDELVRDLGAAGDLLHGCDLLLVVGTSAQVAPASLLPVGVRRAGGAVVEMNLEPTELTRLGAVDVVVTGPVETTLPVMAERLIDH